ncbi:spore coat U domain-containing protein [Amylibacter sp.]|nr:spore coat U domain-containing protein [Amylibacter sp.]
MKMKYKQKNIKLGIVSAIALGSIGLSSASFAGSESANMLVKASVSSSCTITTTEINFGTYDSADEAAKSATTPGNVTYNCTAGTAGTVQIGSGSNVDSDNPGTDASPNRRMMNSGQYLAYSLYSDLSDTVWGNTAGAGMLLAGTGANVPLPIYGAIAAAQPSTAGDYLDTVSITLHF